MPPRDAYLGNVQFFLQFTQVAASEYFALLRYRRLRRRSNDPQVHTTVSIGIRKIVYRKKITPIFFFFLKYFDYARCRKIKTVRTLLHWSDTIPMCICTTVAIIIYRNLSHPKAPQTINRYRSWEITQSCDRIQRRNTSTYKNEVLHQDECIIDFWYYPY